MEGKPHYVMWGCKHWAAGSAPLDIVAAMDLFNRLVADRPTMVGHQANRVRVLTADGRTLCGWEGV